ncbi:MAG: AAA family ATPase [Burkholderia sp.]
MHITQIEIKNVGGIKDLRLNLDRRMNLISGPNGIGKTTILDCVAQQFTAYSNAFLKRRAGSESGSVKAWLQDPEQELSYNVKAFFPNDTDYNSVGIELSRRLLSLKVARTFAYAALPAVTRDAERDPNTLSNDNRNGLRSAEVKNWLVNRYLYSPHPGALTPSQLHNLEVAKRFFSIMNPNFKFSRVDAGTNEIMLETPGGEIFYEYLSAGFKSCMSMLLGITKELEFRFKDPSIKVDEFAGVILIDELELHLHPEWQSKIAEILLKAFPSAQFIATTHSPHIIQSSEPEQVIALELTADGVGKRDLPSGKYGFKGWTVEEVLEDVMGMSDTRTNAYKQAAQKFEGALDAEDYDSAASAYGELDLLLHPKSHLRKLFAFQLGALRG